MNYHRTPEGNLEALGAKIRDAEASPGSGKAYTKPRRKHDSARGGAGWLQKCITEKGKPIPNLANAMIALREDPALRDAFAYDEMLRAVIVVGQLPGDGSENQNLPRPVRDADVSNAQEYLQLVGLPRIGRDTLHQAVDLRGMERGFHPLRDYLTSLRWDDTPRLDTWLCRYLGAKNDEYTCGIGRMFLIAMVARAFEPGCKADYMPVLVGPQGARKSTVCQVLGGPWYSDSLPDIRSAGKELAQHLNGKWLIEVGELASIDKTEAAALKAFITRAVERYRPSFGRKEVFEPRQCLFVGTTNKEVFLRDETGGRRFWPVTVGTIDSEALIRDRDQLFAEALCRYRKKARWWPDQKFEQEHIQPQQEAHYEADAWEEKVAKFLEGAKKTTVIQIARSALFIDTPKLGTTEQRRIVAILERLEWRRGERTKTERPWNAPAPRGDG